MVGRLIFQILLLQNKQGLCMTRAISDSFMNDLQEGKLAGLTRKIQNDDTLMLALRGNYVNVYYRGGSILRLTEQNSSYAAWFDKNYTDGQEPTDLPKTISSAKDCAAWLAALPTLKEAMNAHFATKRKSEREFQQLVAWENNRSLIAGDTEYFITDIEFADAEQSARLDMLGLKWRSSDRKDETTCRPVFIEMKYGINAYEGEAGILKHIEDLRNILENTAKCERLNTIISDQFAQLLDLKLVNFNRNATYTRAVASGRPEVVFVLANHNPRSRKLLKIISEIQEPKDFDLRFFTASFAGYGMHDACMLDLTRFKALLAQLAS
jgi:hypothetical protein